MPSRDAPEDPLLSGEHPLLCRWLEACPILGWKRATPLVGSVPRLLLLNDYYDYIHGSTREASHIPDPHELTSRRRGRPGAGPNSAAVSSGPARQYVARTGNRREGRAATIH